MCMRKLQLVWGNRDKAVIVLSCPKGDPNAFTPQESDVFKRYRMDPKNYKVCRPFALLAPSIVADARHAPLVSALCLQRGDAIKVGAWSSSLIMWQVFSLTADVQDFCVFSRALFLSQILAVNDAFPRITGHPPTIHALSVFWGQCTDKAKPSCPPDPILDASDIRFSASRCPGHAEHHISREILFADDVLPGTHVLRRVSLRLLTRVFVSVQAETKLLDLSLSRSVDANIK